MRAGVARLFRLSAAGIFAGFAMGTRDEMLAVERLLRASLPGQITTHVLRSPRYRGFMCELAPGGCDEVVGRSPPGEAVGHCGRAKSAPWATT